MEYSSEVNQTKRREQRIGNVRRRLVAVLGSYVLVLRDLVGSVLLATVLRPGSVIKTNTID